MPMGNTNGMGRNNGAFGCLCEQPKPDRATMLKRLAQSRILKKLPRASGGDRTREGARLPDDRNLVRRRGPHRSEEQDHPPVGEARHSSERSPRSTHRFHLHLRRGLPTSGQGRGPDPASLQHRGHEPAPRGDRQNCRACAHAVLLVDQAGWHLSTRLVVPANITIIALPPKCPELNPVENVWQFLRDNWLSNRVTLDDVKPTASRCLCICH